ncbi:hypothetical protein VPHD479_0031 [Vibrio phage D479]
MLKYKLVVHHSIGGFETAMNEALAEGWELHGNPFSKDSCYCQAMTRKATIDELLE